jgi:hypothetical protein
LVVPLLESVELAQCTCSSHVREWFRPPSEMLGNLSIPSCLFRRWSYSYASSPRPACLSVLSSSSPVARFVIAIWNSGYQGRAAANFFYGRSWSCFYCPACMVVWSCHVTATLVFWLSEMRFLTESRLICFSFPSSQCLWLVIRRQCLCSSSNILKMFHTLRSRKPCHLLWPCISETFLMFYTLRPRNECR